jgi:hypothetical protein
MTTDSPQTDTPTNVLLEKLLIAEQPAAPTQTQDYHQQRFLYQLECLKLEIDLIERTISRSATMTLNVKNFAVVAWAASVTIFASQDTLRPFVAFTALIPLLFWIIDAWWTSLERGSRVRLRKIKEFLNSDDLLETFKQQQFTGFQILDVYGTQYKNTVEYKKVTRFWRIFWYRETALLYGGIALISVIFGLLAFVFG